MWKRPRRALQGARGRLGQNVEQDVVTRSPDSTDSALTVVGFTAGNDGVLHAPSDSRVRLAPIGQFYELKISLRDGNALVAVLPKSAIRITRDGKQ
jgi:hypothetical protein